MAVIDGKYLSKEGLEHLWGKLKAILGTKADKSTTYTKTETDSAINDAVNALDVSSVGGTTRYLYQISETNGKISANSYASDTVPTASSTKLVQSGGVKTYVDTECGALAALGAKNLCPYSATSAIAERATPIDNQPINLPAGTYIMSYTQTATTGASSIRFSYNGISVTNFTVNNDSTLTKSKEFTLASPANQIKLYSSVVNDYTEIMIRRKEVSDATYQPYAPTNRELYEMILEVQSQNSVQS